MIDRYQIMRIHVLLAGFLLPVAIVYFAGGALYTLGIKGHIEKQQIVLQLDQPLEPNLDQLTQLVTQALQERKLPLPGGEPVLRKKRGSYELRWDDLEYLVTLAPDRKNALHADLTVRERSLLTQVMRIHRAEAGSSFKVLTIILVIGLTAIFASGIYMAQSIPRLRRPMLISILAGTATFLVLILIQ